jgi:hypothetical protein
MVHMTYSRRLCRVEAKDEQIDTTSFIGPFYLNFIILVVIAHRSILVF